MKRSRYLIALLVMYLVFPRQELFASGNPGKVVVGAVQLSEYLPLLKGKSVAIVANPTSMVGKIHLVDTLKSLGVHIQLVFAPEHGFRGEAEAGEDVKGGIDKKSGLKVISLYGDHKKPRNDDLANVQIVIFDIQDVGTRFYTYISTLQYMMEVCAIKKIPIVILDRPNPHGYYIDGPVLDTSYSSFVGMQPIPVVHGLTVAEYATMLNGEKWLANGVQCKLYCITMKGWGHTTYYKLPVKPSPNLPNMNAVNLYPSLCFFEGTIVSVGRGTSFPFQIIGYPGKPSGDYVFTPKSIPGLAKNPPYEGKECRGFDLGNFGGDIAKNGGKLYINWLIQSYQEAPDSAQFFNSFFDKLAGSSQLREQIRAGWTEEQIRNSWGPDLEKFMVIRKKYLLYKDFKWN